MRDTSLKMVEGSNVRIPKELLAILDERTKNFHKDMDDEALKYGVKLDILVVIQEAD